MEIKELSVDFLDKLKGERYKINTKSILVLIRKYRFSTF